MLPLSKVPPVFVLALALIACHKETTPPAAIQTVRAATVQEIRPDAPQRYSATIAPSAQVDLAFKSAGLIERIHQVRGADGRTRDVQAGDKVTQGTELAVVRRVDYQQHVQQAQDQVGQAQAQLVQAEAAFKQAELDYTRAKNLFQTASLTKPEYDQAAARYESTKGQVEGAKAAIANAQTVVSQAALTLSDTSVRAPFTGWITARNVERGSLVGNATPGFSMVDTHIVKAIFAVPDTSLKIIQLGRRLTVLLDAVQHAVTGTVTAISPQADPRTRVFSVEISLPNPTGEIRPGMIGSVTLGPSREPEPRLTIPLSAVVRAPDDPNGYAVFQVQERSGRTYALARRIAIGNTFGNSIEVTSGLNAGDRIVGLGGELLRNGQEVRVLP